MASTLPPLQCIGSNLWTYLYPGELGGSQTPHEYIQSIAVAAPDEAPTLQRFEDIYVRELWASPDSTEHPLNTGEVRDLPALWQRLQPRLFLYVVKHPRVLMTLPNRTWKSLLRLRAKRRARRALEQDL
ncbi:MAG: DUF4129 domain-containing protein [Chloroflexi bacterium]|nr:MAG: DUF4129 domain-containing protein [Chloroflexota bacterium]